MMVKTGVALESRDEVSGSLFTGQLASGIEMARLRFGPMYGTWERVGVMQRERGKQAVPVSH